MNPTKNFQQHQMLSWLTVLGETANGHKKNACADYRCHA
jgi:hypothetical protein